MKHRNEIIRWSNCLDGIGVWRSVGDFEWELTAFPTWHPDAQYVVDDEYAELRKHEIDNPGTTQVRFYGEYWTNHNNPDWSLPVSKYRIRTKTETRWQWLYKYPNSEYYEITETAYANEEEVWVDEICVNDRTGIELVKIEESAKKVEK